MRVKNPSISAAPRRSNWKRRGAFFGLCTAAGALIVVVFGRTIPDLSLLTAPSAAPLPDRSRQAKRNRSLSDALGKIDAQTVQAYLKRYSQPEKAAISGAPRTVWIDSESLARRHPAWRLAAEIERGAVSPRSPRIAQVLAPQRNGEALAGAMATGSPPFRTQIAPRTVTVGAGSNSALQNAATPALQQFLADSAARTSKRAGDEAFLARRALDDAVALARRGAVSDAEIAILPPDVALELLNLRLELLRNLARTPAQRAASREQIRLIEARYAAILGAQTDAQAARLRAATLEIPDRTLREGRLQIARESQRFVRRDEQIRLSLLARSREERRRDTRNGAPLRLTLPSLQIAQSAQSARAIGSDSRVAQAAPQFFETARARGASEALLETARAQSSAARALFAARLRTLARRDAAQWATQTAAHFGAKLESGAANREAAPDFTAQAQRLLFPVPR